MESIQEFCKNVSRGTMGITLITVTEPKMRKTNNPYYGRVLKATCMANVGLGVDYQNTVNNRLGREDKDKDFKAEKPKGKTWEMYPYILQSEKDSQQKYLRVTMYKNTKSVSKYIIDNRWANDEEVDLIKSYLPTIKVNNSQGLNEGNEVIVRDFKFENVICLSQGQKEFNCTRDKIPAKIFRNFFK